LLINREQLIYNQEINLVWDVIAAEPESRMDAKAMGVVARVVATV
jgi:hypothetical protein